MGREIEVKIPVSKQKFERLYRIFITGAEAVEGISGIRSSSELIVKKDEYWSRYNTRQERLENKEPQVIRIRTEESEGKKSESYFTLKYKTRENGIELNKEDETFVEDPEVLREFFAEAGYHRWFNKVKKNYSAFCFCNVLKNVEFHVELEDVNGLLYVEIEVTGTEGDAAEIKNALNDFVKLLGLNPEDKDCRSWVEIIESSAGKN